MNKQRKTQQYKNLYRLSQIIESKRPYKYKYKQLNWPEKSIKPTNRVEKSKQSKSIRTFLSENTAIQKQLGFNKPSHQFVTTDLVFPKQIQLNFRNIQRSTIRSKSKKKIVLTDTTKRLNYTHINSLNVFDKIQDWMNHFFINSDGCSCPENCRVASYLIKWSQQFNTHPSLYNRLKYIEPEKNNNIQINKDISRTQPHVDSFKTQKYLKMLQNILKAYSNYDSEVGYVQGMNILVSSLIYHIKQQQKTFWVFCKLMQECNVRKLFLKDFEMVHSHLKNIEKLVEEWINDLYQHLLNNDILISQVCFSWVLTLMSVFVDVQNMKNVIYYFVEQRWIFLYKAILAYLLYHKQTLMSEQDSSNLLIILSVNYGQTKTNWKQVFRLAKTLCIRD